MISLSQLQKFLKVINNPMLSNIKATMIKRLNQLKAGSRVALSLDIKNANKNIKLATNVIIPKPIGRIKKYTCHTVVSPQFLLLTS